MSDELPEQLRVRREKLERIRAEGRDVVYKFDRYGFDKTQHDIAWQGGVTLSF